MPAHFACGQGGRAREAGSRRPVKPSWPTHKRAAADKEAKRPLGILRDSDPDAGSDGRFLLFICAKPQCAGNGQIYTVEPAIDCQSLSQSARSSRQIPIRHIPTVEAHQWNPFHWFQGTEQHPGAGAFWPAGYVEHPGCAVGAVDVGVSGAQEQRTVARGNAPEAMGGGIIGQIGLGLDNPAHDSAVGQFADDQLAKQPLSESFSVSGKLPAGNRADSHLQAGSWLD